MNNKLISGRLRGSLPLISTSGKALVSLKFSPIDIPAPKHTKIPEASASLGLSIVPILGSLEYKHGNSLVVALSVSRSEDSRHLISSIRGAGSYGRLGVVGDVLRRWGEEDKTERVPGPLFHTSLF